MKRFLELRWLLWISWQVSDASRTAPSDVVRGAPSRRFRNGGFDPEDLAMLDGVFADCWKQIEGRYTVANGDERNAARENLATIIVALAEIIHDARVRKRRRITQGTHFWGSCATRRMIFPERVFGRPCAN